MAGALYRWRENLESSLELGRDGESIWSPALPVGDHTIDSLQERGVERGSTHYFP